MGINPYVTKPPRSVRRWDGACVTTGTCRGSQAERRPDRATAARRPRPPPDRHGSSQWSGTDLVAMRNLTRSHAGSREWSAGSVSGCRERAGHRARQRCGPTARGDVTTSRRGDAASARPDRSRIRSSWHAGRPTLGAHGWIDPARLVAPGLAAIGSTCSSQRGGRRCLCRITSEFRTSWPDFGQHALAPFSGARYGFAMVGNDVTRPRRRCHKAV